MELSRKQNVSDQAQLEDKIMLGKNISMKFQILHVFAQNFKGTVSVISSVPPCKDGNFRFLMVSLKDNVSFFFLQARNAQITFAEKPQMEIHILKIHKHEYFRRSFRGYRCKSGIAICEWRFNLNYANSPFKSFDFVYIVFKSS